MVFSWVPIPQIFRKCSCINEFSKLEVLKPEGYNILNNLKWFFYGF